MSCTMIENHHLTEDLKLTILSSAKICPPEPSEKRSMFLSNIDQQLNYNLEMVHFFAANRDFSPEKVVQMLRTAVQRVLVPYDFLAGRLRMVNEGKLEIDCNSAGVDFIVAESELSLHEIGDIENVSPAHRLLVIAGCPEKEGMKLEEKSLCTFQVTLFRCGGFALGVSFNHTTLDGMSMKALLQNLAMAAAGNISLPHPPFNDRRLLSPRSPPRVLFPHPEHFTARLPSASSTPIAFKIVRLSPSDISSLKLHSIPIARCPTTFSVVVAHLWRCKTLAAAEKEWSPTTQILFAVDIRKRIVPSLPESFAGNAVLLAYGEATTEVVRGGEFGRVVEAVRNGVERMGEDEYIRSMIDWSALHRGYPKRDFAVSSWLKLGFSEVSYPWGKAVYSSPVGLPMKNVMVLFPSIACGGVNVLVALAPEEMESFEKFFYQLIVEI